MKRKITEKCSIDSLPDDVLTIILSCLKLEEAVRTSVLSRRWRYLWESANPILQFEQRNVRKVSSEEATAFVNWVKKAMAGYNGSSFDSVDELIIRFSTLAHVDPNPMCDWIHFAMQKKVRHFELASSFCDSFPDLYKFLSIPRATELEGWLLSLTSFRLANFCINNDMIEYILSNCPNLEQLSLKGGTTLSTLNIVSSSLKSLSVCTCWNLQELKISAANLVSVEYINSPFRPGLQFWFQDVPRLSKITSDVSYLLSLMDNRDLHQTYYNQLEKLVLDLPGEVVHWPFYTSPTYGIVPCLRGLKQLELVIAVMPGASLLFFVFWPMACPFLSNFSVRFNEQSHTPWGRSETALSTSLRVQRKCAQEQLNSYRHENLKEVKLIDFVGHESYVEFALDLLGISKSLHKLIIKPKTDADRAAILEQHAKLLRANLPAEAELKIR